jgi:hypothetical protein
VTISHQGRALGTAGDVLELRDRLGVVFAEDEGDNESIYRLSLIAYRPS